MKRTLWRKKPWKARQKPKMPPQRKIRLKTIKSLKMKLWSLFSQFIRQRDKGFCKTCNKWGHWKSFDCGHYKPNSERNMSLGGNELWWFEKNFASQCFACNRMKSGNLSEFAIYLEATYGIGILQEIHTRFNTPKKWTREELETKIAHYKALVV